MKFTSNKLDDLGKALDLGRKIKNEPGLWIKAAQGDVKSIRAMVRYNKGDIPPLEALYERLKPYMENHPNKALYEGKNCCPKCESVNFLHQGHRYTSTGKYARYQCRDCFGWFSSKHRMATVGVK